jgi:MFS family permease
VAIWILRLPEDRPRESLSPFIHLRKMVARLTSENRLGDYLGVLGIGLAIVAIGIGFYNTVVPLFLEAEFGVPVEWRGVVIAGFQVGSGLTGLVVGGLRARFTATALVVAGIIAMVIGNAVVAAAPLPAVVAVGMAVTGVGFSLFIPIGQRWMSEAATPAFRGTSVGVWMMINRVAQTGAPPVGSGITDRAGARTALTAAGVALAVGAFLWRPFRRGLRRQPTTLDSV